jgi:hypothetical protein
LIEWVFWISTGIEDPASVVRFEEWVSESGEMPFALTFGIANVNLEKANTDRERNPITTTLPLLLSGLFRKEANQKLHELCDSKCVKTFADEYQTNKITAKRAIILHYDCHSEVKTANSHV